MLQEILNRLKGRIYSWNKRFADFITVFCILKNAHAKTIQICMYSPEFIKKLEISNNLQVSDTIQDSSNFYEAKEKKIVNSKYL